MACLEPQVHRAYCSHCPTLGFSKPMVDQATSLRSSEGGQDYLAFETVDGPVQVPLIGCFYPTLKMLDRPNLCLGVPQRLGIPSIWRYKYAGISLWHAHGADCTPIYCPWYATGGHIFLPCCNKQKALSEFLQNVIAFISVVPTLLQGSWGDFDGALQWNCSALEIKGHFTYLRVSWCLLEACSSFC